MWNCHVCGEISIVDGKGDDEARAAGHEKDSGVNPAKPGGFENVKIKLFDPSAFVLDVEDLLCYENDKG